MLERLIEDISFEAPDKAAAAGDKTLAELAAEEQGPPVEPSEPSQLPFVDAATILAEVQEMLAQDALEGSSRRELQSYVDMEEYYVEHVVDKQQVREKLQGLLKQDDLSKYIL